MTGVMVERNEGMTEGCQGNGCMYKRRWSIEVKERVRSREKVRRESNGEGEKMGGKERRKTNQPATRRWRWESAGETNDGEPRKCTTPTRERGNNGTMEPWKGNTPEERDEREGEE